MPESKDPGEADQVDAAEKHFHDYGCESSCRESHSTKTALSGAPSRVTIASKIPRGADYVGHPSKGAYGTAQGKVLGAALRSRMEAELGFGAEAATQSAVRSVGW